MSTEAETPVQEPEQPLAETPKESTEVKGSKKKEKKAKKPPRTSMEGMIFNGEWSRTTCKCILAFFRRVYLEGDRSS